MGGYIKRHLVDPFIMPIVFFGILGLIIVTIGESLLALFTPGEDVDRIDRPELWLALGLALVILLGFAFLYTRPKGTLGPLDRDVAIGGRSIFDRPEPTEDLLVRQGELGTVADIQPGYTLYAGNGELATVRGMLPGATDFGKRFAGFIYAEGLRGASDELWIPIEAVMSVYPETRSVLLAIKGDETDYFGWNEPPESLRRRPARKTESL
jgi:hypothetical protein